jgi:hypothetical protein
MRLTPHFQGVSANQHADPTPRLRGGDLLIIDGLELRRSRTPAVAGTSGTSCAPRACSWCRSGSPTSPQKGSPPKRTGNPAWWRPASRPRRTTPSPTRCRIGPGARRAEIWAVSGGAAYAGKPRPLRLADASALRRQFANHVGPQPNRPPAHVRAPGHRSPRVILVGPPPRPCPPSPWRRPDGMTNCERHRQSAGTTTLYARPRWHRVAPQMPPRGAYLRCWPGGSATLGDPAGGRADWGSAGGAAWDGAGVHAPARGRGLRGVGDGACCRRVRR